MIIYGKNPVVEAIRNKRNISKMVVLEGLKDQNFLKLLKENRIKYELLPQHIFSKRYGDKTGGIVAEINEYKYATLEQSEVAYEALYGTYIAEEEYAANINGKPVADINDETLLIAGSTWTTKATTKAWNSIKSAHETMNGEVN